RTDRAHDREEHQRDRDHLDQVDVDRAQRAEPGLRRGARQPAGERAQHEAGGDALPERDPQPGAGEGHAGEPWGEAATLAHCPGAGDVAAGTAGCHPQDIGADEDPPRRCGSAHAGRRAPRRGHLRLRAHGLPKNLLTTHWTGYAMPGSSHPKPRRFRSPAAVPAAALLPLLLLACSATPPRADPPPAPVVEVPAIRHPDGETPQWWYRSGAARAAANGAMQGRAKNVIVFLGDGMSLTTVAAARIFDGQRAGTPGEEHLLSWERFPHTAFSKTYNTDSQTPDSAGTMTAIATGVKSHMGAIGVSAGARWDCAGSRGRELLSWLRLAASSGMSTGIVTTARLTHATPAATYAHAPDRNWEPDAVMPATARDQGCRDIASQLLDFAPGTGPKVLLGGGRAHFLPTSERDLEHPDKVGLRLDGRHLVREWLQRHPGGAYAWNATQLEAATDADAILGLFEFDHMRYEHDRPRDPGGEPDLETMTREAIRRLSRDPAGFVLLVEGGRIDHANHEGNAYRALDETSAMSRAVRAAAELTSPEDTLIVVTADHSHTLG